MACPTVFPALLDKPAVAPNVSTEHGRGTRHPRSVSVSNAVHPAVYEIVPLGLFVSLAVSRGRLTGSVGETQQRRPKSP